MVPGLPAARVEDGCRLPGDDAPSAQGVWAAPASGGFGHPRDPGAELPGEKLSSVIHSTAEAVKEMNRSRGARCFLEGALGPSVAWLIPSHSASPALPLTEEPFRTPRTKGKSQVPTLSTLPAGKEPKAGVTATCRSCQPQGWLCPKQGSRGCCASGREETGPQGRTCPRTPVGSTSLACAWLRCQLPLG